MIHHVQVVFEALLAGFSAHMEQWDGWAALIAGALFGWRNGSVWTPVVVALVVNPAPYGIVDALIHGRHASLSAAATFTLLQLAIASLGYVAGRLVKRFR